MKCFNTLFYPVGYNVDGGLLVVKPDGEKEFNVRDHIGNVRATYTFNRGFMDYRNYDFKPFGDTLSTYGGREDGWKGFNGELKDLESSFMNMGARIYDPQIGRFLSVDPLFEAFPNQSPYSYSFNNPLSFKDPSGLAPEKEKGAKVKIQAEKTIDEIMQEAMNQKMAEEIERDWKAVWASTLMLAQAMWDGVGTKLDKIYFRYLFTGGGGGGGNSSSSGGDNGGGSEGGQNGRAGTTESNNGTDRPDLTTAKELTNEEKDKLNELQKKSPLLDAAVKAYKNTAEQEGKVLGIYGIDGNVSWAQNDSKNPNKFNIYFSEGIRNGTLPEWQSTYLYSHEYFHFFDWLNGGISNVIYGTIENNGNTYNLLTDEVQALQFGNSILLDYYEHNNIPLLHNGFNYYLYPNGFRYYINNPNDLFNDIKRP